MGIIKHKILGIKIGSVDQSGHVFTVSGRAIGRIELNGDVICRNPLFPKIGHVDADGTLRAQIGNWKIGLALETGELKGWHGGVIAMFDPVDGVIRGGGAALLLASRRNNILDDDGDYGSPNLGRRL